MEMSFRGKWICTITDPVISKEMCLRTGLEAHRFIYYNVSVTLSLILYLYIFLLKKALKLMDILEKSIISLSKLEILCNEKRKSLAAGHSNGDLLGLVLKACEDPDNQMLSDTELRCNLAIFMVTAAAALSSLLYLLAIHKQKVQEKAREEVL
ncbi:hypothetical protein C2G38_2042894 [Gigaspora rosea]|uniref:Uncharacterized protein n=1 Tax=Gigaspora rosea TaxID=44941 RepID=A0A397ULQ3_9GLOM|nr:hypothetical protein C2G38_2042894 [Gigaspora rosea]